MEFRIDVRRCLYVLLRKISYVILLCALVFAGTYYINQRTGVDLYAAKSTVYSTSEAIFTVDQARQMSLAMQQYVSIVTSRKVLSNAAELMGYMEGITGDALQNMVTASYSYTNSMIDIEAKSPSPRVAMSAANAVAMAFSVELTSITGRSSAQVLDVASTYYMVNNARTQRLKNSIFATMLVGMIACMGIVLMEVLSKNITSLSDVSLDGSLEVIGVIPMAAVERSRRR